MKRIFLCLALAASAVSEEPDPERDGLLQLLSIKRVYVDKLTGGETALQMRDLLMSSLQGARLFVITENQERADAVLRGAAEDLVFTEVHSSSEGVNARANIGGGRSTRTRAIAGAGVGDQESSRIEERRHEAVSAVRLVNKEGDVIWSTTQESRGAKFRGASADVAEKITRRLLEDFERAKKLRAASLLPQGRDPVGSSSR